MKCLLYLQTIISAIFDRFWIKEGCTNKKSREKKRGEREILINPVHRENGQERREREKAKAWLDIAGTQLVNNQSL